MFKEFREFAMRGHVLDMAVGILIGGAFGKIIRSFVGDVLRPPIGLLLGKVDFSNLFIEAEGIPLLRDGGDRRGGTATAPTTRVPVWVHTSLPLPSRTVSVHVKVPSLA